MNDKAITFCPYEDFKKVFEKIVQEVKEIWSVLKKAVQWIFKAYISSYKKIYHLAYKCKKQRIRNKNKKRLLIYYGTLTAL